MWVNLSKTSPSVLAGLNPRRRQSSSPTFDPYLSSVHLPWNPNICLYIVKFIKVPRSRFIRQAKCLWKDNGNSSGGPLAPFCCLCTCVVHSHTSPVKWHEWQHFQESEYCQTNTQQSQKHILQKMSGVKWQARNGLGYQFFSLCFCSCLMLKRVNLKLYNKWIPAWSWQNLFCLREVVYAPSCYVWGGEARLNYAPHTTPHRLIYVIQSRVRHLMLL